MNDNIFNGIADNFLQDFPSLGTFPNIWSIFSSSYAEKMEEGAENFLDCLSDSANSYDGSKESIKEMGIQTLKSYDKKMTQIANDFLGSHADENHLADRWIPTAAAVECFYDLVRERCGKDPEFEKKFCKRELDRFVRELHWKTGYISSCALGDKSGDAIKAAKEKIDKDKVEAIIKALTGYIEVKDKKTALWITESLSKVAEDASERISLLATKMGIERLTENPISKIQEMHNERIIKKEANTRIKYSRDTPGYYTDGCPLALSEWQMWASLNKWAKDMAESVPLVKRASVETSMKYTLKGLEIMDKTYRNFLQKRGVPVIPSPLEYDDISKIEGLTKKQKAALISHKLPEDKLSELGGKLFSLGKACMRGKPKSISEACGIISSACESIFRTKWNDKFAKELYNVTGDTYIGMDGSTTATLGGNCVKVTRGYVFLDKNGNKTEPNTSNPGILHILKIQEETAAKEWIPEVSEEIERFGFKYKSPGLESIGTEKQQEINRAFEKTRLKYAKFPLENGNMVYTLPPYKIEVTPEGCVYHDSDSFRIIERPETTDGLEPETAKTISEALRIEERIMGEKEKEPETAREEENGAKAPEEKEKPAKARGRREEPER